MRNKRGQFYILAAIIIVTILTGLATMSTYVITKPKTRSIDSMHAELKEEGFRIIDYGVKKGIDHIAVGEIREFLDDTLSDNDYKEYFLKKTDNTSIFFIYGFKCDANNPFNNPNLVNELKLQTGVAINSCPSEGYVLFLEKYESSSSGNIVAKIGGSNVNFPVPTAYVTILDISSNADPLTNTLTIELLGQDYVFDLKPNQMFYFIMIQDKDGERYIRKDD